MLTWPEKRYSSAYQFSLSLLDFYLGVAANTGLSKQHPNPFI
jgi:hypothetical protein